MAKKKNIRPFFGLRYEITDTLEALAHEILMSLQAMETAIQLGDMNNAGKKIIQERVDALKALCLSRDDEGGR